MRKNRLHVALFALSLVPAFAQADGSGTLYREGKMYTLPHAYAWRGPDPFDKNKQITHIVFADKSIDAAAVNKAANRGEALDAQLRDAVKVELNIQPDGILENVNTRLGGSSSSQSGSGWYTLRLKRNDAKRIEGRFVTDDAEKKKQGNYHDLHFALDLHGPPAQGAALPPDGGEPAKIYRAYSAALIKGDIDAVLPLMTKARADEIKAHRQDADFKVMFGVIQMSALKQPHYRKGSTSGDEAILEYTGKSDGADTTSTVTMRREKGAWKVEKESTNSRLN